MPSLATGSVPEPVCWLPFVVSVVAEATKAAPAVFVQETAPVAVFMVQSPDAVKPPKALELLYWIWPDVPPGVPPEPPHTAPESIKLPDASISTQWLDVSVPFVVANVEVLPEAVPLVNGDGKLALGRVPDTMVAKLTVLSVASEPSPETSDEAGCVQVNAPAVLRLLAH